MPAYLTPPEIAKALRVRTSKVLTWIRAGTLRAIDVSTPGSRRPRFRVSAAALAEFEAVMAVVPPPPPAPRRRPADADVIQFF